MATTAAISESQPRSRSWPRVLLVLGRVALGAIFLYAAYSKLHFNGAWHLGDYQFYFGMAIDSYKMLPVSVVLWMRLTLPWFESLLGPLLTVGTGLRSVGAIPPAPLVGFSASRARAKIC